MLIASVLLFSLTSVYTQNEINTIGNLKFIRNTEFAEVVAFFYTKPQFDGNRDLLDYLIQAISKNLLL
jgi:hypothetical protein